MARPRDRCQDVRVKQVRPYRGIEAADRLAQRRRQLLEAGLDLLGAEDGEVTVRAVCRTAGLAARYFYESFADKDDFVGAVYDWVIADIATSTQAAVDAVPLADQTMAGMANIVHLIAQDRRIGRLLFSVKLSNEVLTRKRVESVALFATLLGQHAGDALHLQENDYLRATSYVRGRRCDPDDQRVAVRRGRADSRAAHQTVALDARRGGRLASAGELTCRARSCSAPAATLAAHIQFFGYWQNTQASAHRSRALPAAPQP